MLRELAAQLSQALTVIFRNSIESGSLPNIIMETRTGDSSVQERLKKRYVTTVP